jgi:hypothetical protein
MRFQDEGQARDFPFTVARGGPEVFDIIAIIKAGEVKWYLELDWTCAGRRGTMRVDLAGYLIRTMARPGVC